MLIEALEMMGRTGYGADASVGHGAFDLEPTVVHFPRLDDVPGADGFVALSTFQPTGYDPAEASGESSSSTESSLRNCTLAPSSNGLK